MADTSNGLTTLVLGIVTLVLGFFVTIYLVFFFDNDVKAKATEIPKNLVMSAISSKGGPMTSGADIAAWVMMTLGVGGIIGILVWLGVLTQDKDNAAEIRKNLAIVGGVTGILIFVFAAAAYVYFMANINYLTPFLLIMTFVNLFLSLYATSAASLQIVKT
jgi:hypothetical protein